MKSSKGQEPTFKDFWVKGKKAKQRSLQTSDPSAPISKKKKIDRCSTIKRYTVAFLPNSLKQS